MNKDNQLAINLAKKIDAYGGTTYYVGGYVRDKVLNIKNKDIDIEVFGITPELLKDICQQYGVVDEIGESFGILKIHGYDIDISMPRVEHKNGEGHKSFDVSVDPFMSVGNAAKRRDFTINSIMENVLTGEHKDPFLGLSDLSNKVLKHIDETTFVEDPLRVYRAAQFAARFELTVSPETKALCSSIDTSTLSKERVFEETNKALLKANRPSIYFSTLRELNQLKSFFPILYHMIGIEQNPLWHPEGDVWNHTMEVVDKAASYKELTTYPLGFMYAALFHDIGKIYATEVDSEIHAYNHENIGADNIHNAIDPLTNQKQLMIYVENMVRNHMTPHMISKQSSMRSLNRFFDKSIAPYDAVLLSIADTINKKEILRFETGWWDKKLEVYREIKTQPEVMGQDLIDLGYTPGPLFKDILTKCHDIHLAGVNKENVLRQMKSIVKGIHSRRA
jgi:tRNA nucleotidyltransferase (CCA-adding enzyme)